MLRSAALLLVLATAPAAANPAGNVPSAADPGDPIDLHLTLDYSYEVDRATIVREDAGGTTDPTAPLPLRRDLAFHQFRHVVTPRGELGLFHDAWLSVALPIVIAQTRELDLADGVARDASTTIDDGLVPAGGFDARDPGTALAGDGVFRGVTRHGLSQLHLGLGFAPMNQRRDDTKPTWKLGAEIRLAIGKVMRFDPMRTAEETGVSNGVHELRLWSSFDRRFARAEGWFEVFWQVPLYARESSLFDDPGFGATNTGLGQRGGASFGIETYVYEDRVNKNRITVDAGGGLIGHFEGRDYGELWEVFALAGDSRGGGPLVLDADPVAEGVQARSHPGVSNFENYLETVAHAAVRAKLGTTVQFSAGVDVAWRTDHVISFADAGIDLPTCGPGVGRCEDDDNVLVNPGTAEVNPLHVPRVDLVGHRYHAVDGLAVVIGVQGIVLF